jgi:DNA-3-methyladenine glycosylase
MSEGNQNVLGRDFFARPCLAVARELIGVTLCWNGCGGRIVEVEAYAVDGDAACHTATRQASRLFYQQNSPGTAYVYLNYGIHWMLNVLAVEGIILIRAVEPQLGLEAMRARRGRQSLRDLCSGPGKLGQALGLTGQDHGTDLSGGVFSKTMPTAAHSTPSTTDALDTAEPHPAVVADRRIGITKAVDFPWRFLEKDSPWVSVPAGRAR